MEQYIIRGGKPLKGEVTIGGAKNAALGILAAAIMADETVTIENMPNVRDTNVLLQAIQGIGVDGTPVVAFEPCDSSGNTVLGYGNYSSEIGSTNIYGMNVGLYAKNKILINGREYGQNAVLWSGAY